MTPFHPAVVRFLLVLALLCGAGRAPASPIQWSSWHVAIDTGALAGGSGYLDFLLLGLADAQPVQATIGNFSGAFAAGTVLSGDAGGDIASGVTLGNGASWNEFAQWADFGGIFTFDVSFAVEDDTGPGTNLGIALLDADFAYLGLPGDAVTFALQPGIGPVVTAQDGVATVNAIPEPSATLQVATGLLLLAAFFRRTRRR